MSDPAHDWLQWRKKLYEDAAKLQEEIDTKLEEASAVEEEYLKLMKFLMQNG